MCDDDTQIYKMEMYYKRISFNVETDARSTLYQILTYELILEMRIIQVYSCKRRFFQFIGGVTVIFRTLSILTVL